MNCSEHVLDYLDLIDVHYKEALIQKLSRFSTDWGIWSAEMNRECRKKIKDNHPDSMLLKYVFTYWVNRSNLLELNHKAGVVGKLYKKAVRSRLVREGKRLKHIIFAGDPPDDLTEALDVLVESGVMK